MQNRVLCSETTYSSKGTLRPKSPAPVLEWGGQGLFRNLLCQTRIRRLSRPPRRPRDGGGWGSASARRRRDAGHGVGITVSHALPQPVTRGAERRALPEPPPAHHVPRERASESRSVENGAGHAGRAPQPAQPPPPTGQAGEGPLRAAVGAHGHAPPSAFGRGGRTGRWRCAL